MKEQTFAPIHLRRTTCFNDLQVYKKLVQNQFLLELKLEHDSIQRRSHNEKQATIAKKTNNNPKNTISSFTSWLTEKACTSIISRQRTTSIFFVFQSAPEQQQRTSIADAFKLTKNFCYTFVYVQIQSLPRKIETSNTKQKFHRFLNFRDTVNRTLVLTSFSPFKYVSTKILSSSRS